MSIPTARATAAVATPIVGRSTATVMSTTAPTIAVTSGAVASPTVAAAAAGLGYGSFVNPDGGTLYCRKLRAGGYIEDFVSTAQNFSKQYRECRAHMLADLEFLGQTNARAMRIFPSVTQFIANYDEKADVITYTGLNDNVKNFDEFLGAMERNNLKAHVVLMYGSASCRAYWKTHFNYELLTDPAVQDRFFVGFRQFIERYKNSQTIVSYDLVNEATVLAYYGRQAKPGLCGVPFTRAQARSFFKRMYDTVKAIDQRHPLTFSSGGDLAYVDFREDHVDFFRDIVDFWDIHIYSPHRHNRQVIGLDGDPEVFYRLLDAELRQLDKPIIHGEIGVGSPGIRDRAGNYCEGEEKDFGRIELTEECQGIFLRNTTAFIESARRRGVAALFFHAWPSTKRFASRQFDSDNNVVGYVPTLAGRLLFSVGATRVR